MRQRIRRLLAAHPGWRDLGAGQSVGPSALSPSASEDASRRLAEVEERLTELERSLVGIGHNGPPEGLSDEGITRSEFDEAKDNIRALKEQMAGKPDPVATAKRTRRLKAFGLKVAAWLGGRGTKLVDSISQLVPATVAAGFITALVAALRAISQALGG